MLDRSRVCRRRTGWPALRPVRRSVRMATACGMSTTVVLRENRLRREHQRREYNKRFCHSV
jgi:hypothetical protein